MQNKDKPIFRFPKNCDITYWTIWDETHPNFILIGNLHAQGANKEKQCPNCGSSKLIPKLFGNMDVGYKLIYHCPCEKMQIRFWTEGYEYE